MKYIGLLIAVFILMTVGGCTPTNSTPRHSADEVAAIAESLSPLCLKLLPPPETHGCGCAAAPLYEEVASAYDAQYQGNGMWAVTKTCPVDSQYDRSFTFDDKTNELIWQ